MRSRALIPAAVAALAALVAGCGYPDPNVSSGPAATVSETTPTPQAGADDFHDGAGKTAVKFPDGLQFVDLKVGSGQVVPAGATPGGQHPRRGLHGPLLRAPPPTR